MLPDMKPKRKCYSFTEWNTKRSGSGFAYLPGQTITDVNGNITLYAIWQQNSSVLLAVSACAGKH